VKPTFEALTDFTAAVGKGRGLGSAMANVNAHLDMWKEVGARTVGGLNHPAPDQRYDKLQIKDTIKTPDTFRCKPVVDTQPNVPNVTMFLTQALVNQAALLPLSFLLFFE
jgi:hypothetical protein